MKQGGFSFPIILIGNALIAVAYLLWHLLFLKEDEHRAQYVIFGQRTIPAAASTEASISCLPVPTGAAAGLCRTNWKVWASTRRSARR